MKWTKNQRVELPNSTCCLCDFNVSRLNLFLK